MPHPPASPIEREGLTARRTGAAVIGAWTMALQGTADDGSPVERLVTERPPAALGAEIARRVLREAEEDARAWMDAARAAPDHVHPVLGEPRIDAQGVTLTSAPRGLTLEDLLLRSDLLHGRHTHELALALLDTLLALESARGGICETPELRAIVIEHDPRGRPARRPRVRVAHLVAPQRADVGESARNLWAAQVLYALARRRQRTDQVHPLKPDEAPELIDVLQQWNRVIAGLQDGSLNLAQARKALRRKARPPVVPYRVQRLAAAAVLALLALSAGVWAYLSRAPSSSEIYEQLTQTLSKAELAMAFELAGGKGTADPDALAAGIFQRADAAAKEQLTDADAALNEDLQDIVGAAQNALDWWRPYSSGPSDRTFGQLSDVIASPNDAVEKFSRDIVDASRHLKGLVQLRAALRDALEEIPLQAADPASLDSPNKRLRLWLAQHEGPARQLLSGCPRPEDRSEAASSTTPIAWLEKRLEQRTQESLRSALEAWSAAENSTPPSPLRADWAIPHFERFSSDAQQLTAALRPLLEDGFASKDINCEDLLLRFNRDVAGSDQPSPAEMLAHWARAAGSHAFSAEAREARKTALELVRARAPQATWFDTNAAASSTQGSMTAALRSAEEAVMRHADPLGGQSLAALAAISKNTWDADLASAARDATALAKQLERDTDAFAARLAGFVASEIVDPQRLRAALAALLWAADAFEQPGCPRPELARRFRDAAEYALAFVDEPPPPAARPDGTLPNEPSLTLDELTALLAASKSWRETLRDVPDLADQNGQETGVVLEARRLNEQWHTIASAGKRAPDGWPAAANPAFRSLQAVAEHAKWSDQELHSRALEWAGGRGITLDTGLSLYASLLTRQSQLNLLVTPEQLQQEHALLKNKRLSSGSVSADALLAGRAAVRLREDAKAAADIPSIHGQLKLVLGLLGMPGTEDRTIQKALAWSPPAGASNQNQTTLYDAAWTLAALDLHEAAGDSADRDTFKQAIESLRGAPRPSVSERPDRLTELRDSLTSALQDSTRFEYRSRDDVLEELRKKGPSAAGWTLNESAIIGIPPQHAVYIQYTARAPFEDATPIIGFILVKTSDSGDAVYLQATEFSVAHLGAALASSRQPAGAKPQRRAILTRETVGGEKTINETKDARQLRGAKLVENSSSVQATSHWIGEADLGNENDSMERSRVPLDWWERREGARLDDWPNGPVRPTLDHPLTFLTHAAARQIAKMMGCRLPTTVEWRAALGSPFAAPEIADFRAALNGGTPAELIPNLADASWRLRASDQNAELPESAWEDVGRASWAERGIIADDNHIFLRVVPPQGQLSRNPPRFFDLIGNAAEWLDPRSPKSGTPIAGLSFMTPFVRRDVPPPENQESLIAGLAGEEQWALQNQRKAGARDRVRYGDVGFRLAFSFRAEPDITKEYRDAVAAALNPRAPAAPP